MVISTTGDTLTLGNLIFLSCEAPIWRLYQSALIQPRTHWILWWSKQMFCLDFDRKSLTHSSQRHQQCSGRETVSEYFCFLSEFACFCNLTSPALAYQPPTQGTVITGEIITGVINMSVFCFGNNLILTGSKPPLFVFYLILPSYLLIPKTARHLRMISDIVTQWRHDMD